MFTENEMWQRAIIFDQELSKFNSYLPEGKHQAINYIEKLLKEETTADVQVYDRDTDEPFLIAKITHENAPFKLLLEGHLDVVSPEGMEKPFDGIIQDGWLLGRGVSDMKGGDGALLASFIAAANMPDMKADLYLMHSTDEEYAGEEIKKALREGLIPIVDFAMVAEPTNLGIAHVHKGEAWADVEFFGKSAHSSRPWEGQNAIYMAAMFINKVKEFTKRFDAEETEYGKPAMSVGVIQGGSTPNVVPPYCKFKIDIRYMPGQSAEQYIGYLQGIADECKADWPEFDSKISVTGNWSSLFTDKNNETLVKIREILSRSLGREVPIVNFGGWGEGGFINEYGIPIIYFGPGESKYSHKPDERIKTEWIADCAKAYYDVLTEICF